MFFLIALSVYCYRQRNHRHGSHPYGMGPGAGLRMSQLDNEMDEQEMEGDADETTAVVSHEFSLAVGLDNVAIVSPYRVNTGYRRPAGGDSDHGYSTMTPHEDSEHAASFVEPLLVGRDRYRPTVRSTSGGSFSSRASSPLGPVYSRSNHRVESPGTLHESADELEGQRLDSDAHRDRPANEPPGTTVLPDSVFNQIVVPVTVHMVDTV